MDRKIPMYVELINTIIGLLMEGKDPTIIFVDKHGNRTIVVEVMEKYGATCGSGASKSPKLMTRLSSLGRNCFPTSYYAVFAVMR